MRCKLCHKKLEHYGYLIGGKEYCLICSLEMVSDLTGLRFRINEERISK